MTADATMTKLTATPAEVALRKSIPTKMVDSQTATPVGAMAVGLRQPRTSTHPIAVPARNGHAVWATPATVSPSAWLRRPMVQNSTTPTMSTSAASALLRFIVHHVENQWADAGFVTGCEVRLQLRGLSVQQRVEGILGHHAGIEP